MAKSKEIVSIMTDDVTHCAICHSSYGLEEHHCLHGSYRHLADEDHLVVPLCRRCHDNLHKRGWFDRDLQEEAQLAYMKHHNATEDEFRARYGKSWLKD